MFSREFRRSAMSIGVFVLPVVAVKMVAVLAGGGNPITAYASIKPIKAQIQPLDTAAPTWSKHQLAAADQVRMLETMPFGKSPLLDENSFTTPAPLVSMPGLQQSTQPGMQHQVTPQSVLTMPEPATEFFLQVVFTSPHGVLVVINDRRYELGDQIDHAPWMICAVDPIKFLAVLRHTGTEETMTIGREIRRRGGECTCGARRR